MAAKTLSQLTPLMPVTIEFSDLNYTVHQDGYGPKTILRNINGLFKSGELTCILGPSGAGKSTLLNLLAGYKCENASGTICVNGRPREMRLFRRISRYIMQEDLLQPHLSVDEAMHAASQLKLGLRLEPRQRQATVDEILELLRLTRAKNTRTEKLSGGERKRLSIALELINNPPVMFLDEPTTGLDDLSSAQCLSLLKALAAGGRTVVCVIHTPSARLFHMIDNVYVVAEGQCVFQGAATQVIPFLHASCALSCPKTYNPADFALEAACGEYGENHVERMVAAVENGRCQRWTPNYQHSSLPSRSSEDQQVVEFCELPMQDGTLLKQDFGFALSGWDQFRVLLSRMLLQVWRDSSHLTLKLSLHLALGIIIGGMFYDMGNDGSKTMFNFGFCYTCIIFFLYIPMMPVLLQFPIDVKILKREYFNRWYSLGAYYAAYTISHLPLQIFLGTMYATMVYYLSGQPMEALRLTQFLFMCLMVSLVSESLGLTIGSTLGIVNGMFMGPVLSVPLMLLSCYGMGSGSADIPVLIRVGMNLSYLRYGLEGIIVTMYRLGRKSLPCPIDYCHLREPEALLRHVGMENVQYWQDAVLLILSFVGLRLATFVLLRYRLSSRKSIKAVNMLGQFVKTKFRSKRSA
ncbi:ATP-binding cassette sub-family G member 1-like [Neocloeon triangulifer]|uniref:ATP-binding cassette sub-family G member 1-like n=1 Tax=Neocloeon triangulifer TaxID=2078957 RepID=UPI00286ED363|nr:ATP-binding cassette sub-family G member 1-like [Neocloeon triangulifer]